MERVAGKAVVVCPTIKLPAVVYGYEKELSRLSKEISKASVARKKARLRIRSERRISFPEVQAARKA